MKIGILAGEASGDAIGARLIAALRARVPDLQIEGIGGSAMIAAGCHSLFDIEQLSVMGYIEPLKRLPQLLRLRRSVISHFSQHKPDVFIGIDAPDFNIGIEHALRQQGIPIVHYVSPSVWAWRQYRIGKIKKAVDLMLTLFPFEKAFYSQHQVPAKYVGHPLAAQIPLLPDVIAARRSLCLREQGQYIALLPGSRRQEIQYMAEPMLRAAKKVWEKYPDIRFLTSHVNARRYQQFHECCQKYAPDLPITFYTQRTHDVMAAADSVVVTSGTATLETMLFKKPMVITYRMSWITTWIAKLLVKTPYVGLPNLLADRMLVPELLQDAATPEAISQALIHYLEHPEAVESIRREFTTLHRSLQTESAEDPVTAILSIIKQ